MELSSQNLWEINKMPLIEGKSKKSFSKNIETEMNSGKPQKQSVAIAYAEKKKAEKKKKFWTGGNS